MDTGKETWDKRHGQDQYVNMLMGEYVNGILDNRHETLDKINMLMRECVNMLMGYWEIDMRHWTLDTRLWTRDAGLWKLNMINMPMERDTRFRI